MNILLLAMPDITFGYSTSFVIPPTLGLISLAGNLDKRHAVKIGDLITKRRGLKKAIIESIERTNPQVVGLSAMTFQYQTALKIAQFIKFSYPDIKIALGGYHATTMYLEIAESRDGEYFDFIFRGESDVSFNEAMNKLENGQDLRDVRGLSFKKNGKYVHNQKRELEDLARIKLPDRNARIWNKFHYLHLPFDMIEFSRGCLMSCHFCSIRNMYGKSHRSYDVQRVMEDIENAKRTGIQGLFFTDDNITQDIQKFEQLCDEIINHRHNDIFYAVQASSTGISASENLVKKMARAGFKVVFLGIESGSQKNLAELNKGDIVAKSKLAVKYLHDNDILISGGLIIGNPEDDCDSIEETFKFAHDLEVDFAGVQFLVPYPKTKIRDILLEKGLLVYKDDYKYYYGGMPIARTAYLDDKELLVTKINLTRKYFQTRKKSILKAVLRKKPDSLRVYIGVIKILPDLLSYYPKRWFKRLFLSKKQIYHLYLKKLEKLNQFRI